MSNFAQRAINVFNLATGYNPYQYHWFHEKVRMITLDPNEELHVNYNLFNFRIWKISEFANLRETEVIYL